MLQCHAMMSSQIHLINQINKILSCTEKRKDIAMADNEKKGQEGEGDISKFKALNFKPITETVLKAYC